jgi:hypothetical protein
MALPSPWSRGLRRLAFRRPRLGSLGIAAVAGVAIAIAVAWICGTLSSLRPGHGVRPGAWPRAVPSDWPEPESCAELAGVGVRLKRWWVIVRGSHPQKLEPLHLDLYEVGWPWPALSAAQRWDFRRPDGSARIQGGIWDEGLSDVTISGRLERPLPIRPMAGLMADSLVYAAGVAALAWCWSAHRRHRAARAGRCPSCGYSLTGLPPPSGCPECGYGGAPA